MDGAAWKWSGATWIALRKLRSIQATLALLHPGYAGYAGWLNSFAAQEK